MGFKCGIIGLPNVGKSTLFNLLTKGNSAVANFPFCTIKPNIGIVPVIDERINNLNQIVSPQKTVNAFIEFIDIAGLVKGASQGEGLGNQFLGNIRDVHAIAHVVRCFKDDNITHIYNQVQPIKDIDIINSELILSDFDLCEKTILKLQKKTLLKNKETQEKINTLKKCLNHLKQFFMLKTLNLNKTEKQLISYLRFLTLKPTMYIANINEEKESYYFLDKLNEIAKKEGSIVIPIHANLELDLVKMSDEEKKSFMKLFNIKTLGLNSIISSGYHLLNLITFFTVGDKEIRAWAIPNGSTSIEAAHKIHSDFSKGFIRAQIIKYVDFITYKSEAKIKEMGKFRTEGKQYYIQDGDIIHFLFNV
ncbi:redox-regulated ATPase YchF [Buchnera aphidicola str. APS (Acyrthosiphon pisum)]|uniref:Ribosome-binding ATPase YchF n=2 Tax=Buchnera aphidicola TaxID=9 RepID=YCHF_BUCAI|nr:redox-regulated ATPase YchF [Buchnera aphidicola]P57288.3 RecName: Full=Ribosome-binding ATPase YchF [Buchnera aphidicola str. APS (Acyrthosiphon pisum)]pir/D84952/ GTP-binding protein [imported] - Buchnera sp. (strain APS) [Buchnera sp. (in: enterobacteria)]ADP66586.1 GTP-dependent nucleic acid-binding protein EngD [Buchnera aphidicola str. TLW03 (Acyrthosiphon pisum)]ADP67717.1 GTP-dependent nucleic acid-binding protein EngD [Buchnera aphidicola str. JF98 (Acyrthosiphon pisum)]OQX99587.1 